MHRIFWSRLPSSFPCQPILSKFTRRCDCEHGLLKSLVMHQYIKDNGSPFVIWFIPTPATTHVLASAPTINHQTYMLQKFDHISFRSYPHLIHKSIFNLTCMSLLSITSNLTSHAIYIQTFITFRFGYAKQFFPSQLGSCNNRGANERNQKKEHMSTNKKNTCQL